MEGSFVWACQTYDSGFSIWDLTLFEDACFVCSLETPLYICVRLQGQDNRLYLSRDMERGGFYEIVRKRWSLLSKDDQLLDVASYFDLMVVLVA